MPHPNANSQANLKPFRPGESGNPKGRPPKRETIAQILERFGDIAIAKNKTILGLVDKDIPPELLKTARTLKQLALLKQVLRASAGDLKSIEFISDRCEGKPVATVATMDVTVKPLFDEKDEDSPFGFNPAPEAIEAIGTEEEPEEETPASEPLEPTIVPQASAVPPSPVAPAPESKASKEPPEPKKHRRHIQSFVGRKRG